MAKFGCGHTASGRNAMEYNDHGSRRKRCRICYNLMRKNYQRRKRQAEEQKRLGDCLKMAFDERRTR